MADFSIEHAFNHRFNRLNDAPSLQNSPSAHKLTAKHLIIGLDEVGRGAWAGPVVACALWVNPDFYDHPLFDRIDDSKKILPLKRAKIATELPALSVSAIGFSDVDEIKTHNILGATMRAMVRAFERLRQRLQKLGIFGPDSHILALVDGNQAPALKCDVKTIIKGDQRSLSIASASIRAKVVRDRLMRKMAYQYPYYAWQSNAGYGTKAHQNAIEKHGICLHHRKNFAPIKKYLMSHA
ncbi:MAG: ribonuclease HII [Pseudomonadota bacterium]